VSDRETHNRVAQNITAAFARGEEVLIDPMDYILLDNLPPEGTMFAGAYPDGPTSIELAHNLFEGKLKPSHLAARLRVLRLCGLAVTVNRRGRSDKVWQINEAGDAYLAKWKERQGAAQ